MTKIVQTSNLIVMLDEGLAYRQILTEGHPLETDPNPNWMGSSVGRLGWGYVGGRKASDITTGADSISEAILTRKRCVSPNATGAPTSATSRSR
jgi:hypothetical protein